MPRIVTLARDRIQTHSGFLSALSGPVVLAAAVLGAVLVVNALTGGGYEDVLISALIFVCLSVSLQVILGNTGLVFFGQLAFVAIGAYASGLLTIPVGARPSLLPDLPPWLATLETSFAVSALVGGIVAALVAVIVSPVLVKVSGLAAAVVSLGLMYIINDVLREARTFTRGTQTFSGVPFDASLLSAGFALLVITGVACGFKFSRWGLEARAGREDWTAAEASGLTGPRMRLPALVLSAGLSGIAGAVWAHYLTAFSPATFGVDPAIIVVIMCVLGGVNSVSGAIVGAVLVAVWQELARHVEGGLSIGGVQVPLLPEFGSLTLSLGLILILALRPGGIFGSTEVQILRPPSATPAQRDACPSERADA